MLYNKLVRDKIPALIEAQGKTCVYRDTEWSRTLLRRKLEEEVKEFKESIYIDDSLEELCDIIEVCYAYANRLGCTEDKLNKMRLKKKEEKGGFENDIYLVEVLDK